MLPNEDKRKHLVSIVQQIMDADGTEAELDNLMQELETSVPDPGVSDLIYYPPDGVGLTAEQVVDKALGYRAIQLE